MVCLDRPRRLLFEVYQAIHGHKVLKNYVV